MQYAQLVLSPANGKRLIAKAVLKSKEFRKAMDSGIIVLSLGTTNAFIYEEITGKKVIPEEYAAGIVKGSLGVSSVGKRLKPLVLNKGQIIDLPWQEAIKAMDENSLFIKGANAFDTSGLIGILVGGEGGGTIGQALGFLAVKKIPLMVPVGIEKRLDSVLQAAKYLAKPTDGTKDMQAGMVVVSNSILITEIEAFEILFNVEAALVAAGGISGFEGSGIFVIKGEERLVQKALDTVENW